MNKSLKHVDFSFMKCFQSGKRMKRIFAVRVSLLLLTFTLFVAASSALSAPGGKQTVYASLRSPSTAQTPPPNPSNPFELKLMGPQAAVTQDVLSGPGDWTFVITVKGKVSALGIKIKNNPSAGDVCWSYYQKSPTSNTTMAFSIPAAIVGVCVDPPQFPDINGDPLTVYAFTQGGKSADVTISVTYPDPLL